MNREEAIKATKNGAIAACISGTITLLVVLIALFDNSSDGVLAIWNDPSIFIDVILIFGLAFGVYKKSRTAATVLFIYFIIAKIYISIESGQTAGLIVALVFLYYFGKAIQGAFVFKRIESLENPNYKPAPKKYYYIGIPIIVVFAALIGVGLMTMTSVLPSTVVQTGSEMSQSDKEILIANNIVSNEGDIKYFYSGGLSSILEGGTVLTDDRVILYLPDENSEIGIYELFFTDITYIELVQTGNLVNDSTYKIGTVNPDAWLQISLSAEKRGDVVFMEELRKNIRKKNDNPPN